MYSVQQRMLCFTGTPWSEVAIAVAERQRCNHGSSSTAVPGADLWVFCQAGHKIHGSATEEQANCKYCAEYKLATGTAVGQDKIRGITALTFVCIRRSTAKARIRGSLRSIRMRLQLSLLRALQAALVLAAAMYACAAAEPDAAQQGALQQPHSPAALARPGGQSLRRLLHGCHRRGCGLYTTQITRLQQRLI